MKKANGIVLDKPGKPNYRTQASFRFIVLRETDSKILERLSSLRLASATSSLGLLHPNQCGSQAGLGCFDAVATLTHEVLLLQAASFIVSTLFLDVKGSFDNICANKLANILTKGGVSPYLVAWIKSFLSKRQCRLFFQGAPKVFCPVAVGTPQGFRISPLLFVLYIATLSSCEVASLLAHPYYTLLLSFPETAGTCQSLFRYNPMAQCSWQRPLLLV